MALKYLKVKSAKYLCLLPVVLILVLVFRRDVSICIARISYGNVSGWLGVCHSRYCIKTTKPILKLFRPSGSPIIEAFGIPCADTKFQGEPLHRGRLIHGGGENWRFSTEMADISETVRDMEWTMVTMER